MSSFPFLQLKHFDWSVEAVNHLIWQEISRSRRQKRLKANPGWAVESRWSSFYISEQLPFHIKQRLIPDLPFSPLPGFQGAAVPRFTVFCSPSEKNRALWEVCLVEKVTGCLCGRDSCHTLWPGGPNLERARACCVWSRARKRPAHRPCSGASTWLEWKVWSTGCTWWCPGLAPSSLAEPRPSRNLKRTGKQRRVSLRF